MIEIGVTDRAASGAARGIFWIYSNEIVKKPADAKAAWCQFICRDRVIATGYFNPHSLIAGRVVSLTPQENIPDLLRDKLQAAYLRRVPFGSDESRRLVFSEADSLPGLIVDAYGGVLVLQSGTAGIDVVLDDLERLVPEVYEQVFQRKAEALVVRGDAGVRQLEGVPQFSKIVFGDEGKVTSGGVNEAGVKYAANFLEGQKSGFFLDQRDNRNFLAELIKKSKVSSVLDLFCYSGGWGLRALKEGADQATFVDDSADALALVERGFELNGFPKNRGRVVKSEAFEFLEHDPNFYDVVVADPPAFVKTKKNLPQAMKAYEKLARLSWRRVKPGGVLIIGSCSFHLSEPDFMELLQTSIAKEKGFAHVIYRGGQASDHPVLLSMPETRYLKCTALKKI